MKEPVRKYSWPCQFKKASCPKESCSSWSPATTEIGTSSTVEMEWSSLTIDFWVRTELLAWAFGMLWFPKFIVPFEFLLRYRAWYGQYSRSHEPRRNSHFQTSQVSMVPKIPALFQFFSCALYMVQKIQRTLQQKISVNNQTVFFMEFFYMWAPFFSCSARKSVWREIAKR